MNERTEKKKKEMGIGDIEKVAYGHWYLPL
jgi:hypothetical protein